VSVATEGRVGPERRPARVVPETELSVLLDVGSAWTKAAVVGRAAGRWRVVSGAAQPTAWGEAALVEDLAARLAPHADARLRRRLAALLREAPRITCRSPAGPGRLAVATNTAAQLNEARATAIRAGWRVGAGLAAEDRIPAAEHFHVLRDVDPDLWVVVADTAPHPGRDATWALLAATARPGTPVLVVGSPAAAELVGTRLGRVPAWVGADSGPSLRQALLDRLAQRSGVAEPRALTPIAFGRAMAVLGRGLGLDVLGVDLGATWLSWGGGDGSDAAHDPDRAATALLAGPADADAPEGSRAATEILPTDLDAFATTDALATLRERPATLPATMAESTIAQAIGVDRLAAGRRLLGGTPAVDLIIGGGRLLAGVAHPADAALTLVDGLRPVGVTQLAVDPWAICGPLGALVASDVDEGLETLRDDLLTPLGTAVASRGGRPGQVAFRARLRRLGWPDTPQVEVRTGSLLALPLDRGAVGELEVELERGVTLGRPHRARRLTVAVTGGAVGVILDARDDPIQLPVRPSDARTVIAGWRDALRREARPAAA
jgi:hypothetical protein